ncbi:MAG: LysM peptidoglycan-binding domain-containing protein [Anaerolineales bacterium]
MVDKKIGVRLIVIILLGTMLATACTQSYSQAPAATPTLIPAGLFVSPLPTGVDAMQLVADFGTQTAVAMTANVNATAGTPLAPTTAVTDTPTLQSGTFITPLSGSSTPAVVVTDTPAPGTTSVPMTNTISPVTTSIPTVVQGIPATYTLQQGEFPYCIARRYNLDPEELLRLNNLHDWDAQYLSPGLTLQLPQTGNPWPGVRALHPHPDTYTVSGNNDTTLYGVACYYGDIDPATIAQANNLSLSTFLTAGQQLTIP